jgi:hypothetical protein
MRDKILIALKGDGLKYDDTTNTPTLKPVPFKFLFTGLGDKSIQKLAKAIEYKQADLRDIMNERKKISDKLKARIIEALRVIKPKNVVAYEAEIEQNIVRDRVMRVSNMARLLRETKLTRRKVHQFLNCETLSSDEFDALSAYVDNEDVLRPITTPSDTPSGFMENENTDVAPKRSALKRAGEVVDASSIALAACDKH